MLQSIDTITTISERLIISLRVFMSYQHEDLIPFIYRECASGYPKPVFKFLFNKIKGWIDCCFGTLPATVDGMTTCMQQQTVYFL